MRTATPTLARRGLLVASAAGLAAVAACSEEEPPPAVEDEGGQGAEEPTSAEPSPEPREITITHVGDTMPGSYPNQMASDDGASFFDGVKDVLTGDVVIANMEGALSTLEFDKCGGGECTYFRLPGEYAQVFADAGFHVLNQANNHGWDAGPDGATETQEAIRAAGMEVCGIKDEVALVETESGLTVGLVGFAPYTFYTDSRDLDAVAALVASAKEQADIVIATAHLGAEGTDYRHVPEGVENYLGEDRGDTRGFAHTCIDNGADLVVGHGPHVLRGMEVYNGKLICYSLGNFGGGQNLFSTDGPLGRSAVLSVTLREDGTIVTAKMTATRMDGDGYPQLDDENGAYDDLNELAEDFGDDAATVGDDGVLVLPSA
ncbi:MULTISPECIES: CapA family protein [Glycomyces]|uniref:CapA family protein n=2 Tax=Glycomyces TaxID=58113 RepID=A0A9X3T7V7_9ACTN|nr:CapA family protein [Glycomyces lechevalierae]MDA1384613.1 CapA family protein [Glycomyces lechevalierae]MDR7337934.1 poly-gamma-glutamate capsule biosynthesis protein CapA/YwtB (metallophosphatase superfamily) [Glycomyces lechevalierae]